MLLKTIISALILVTLGCNQNNDQQEIQKWNAAFSTAKKSCLAGNQADCVTACNMGRSAAICTTVKKRMNLSDPKNQKWLADCPKKALENGKACCEKAKLPLTPIKVTAPAPPATPKTPAIPVNQPEPIKIKPVSQNSARFEPVPGRWNLPKVGLPVDFETPGKGLAYLATRGSGLVLLDENGFSTIISEPADILQIAPGKDGAVWLLGHNALYQLRDGKTERFEGSGQSRSFNQMAVGPNNDVWILGLYGISHFSNRSWQLYSKKDLTGGAHTTMYTIQTDLDGRVWISAHESIYVYDQGQWKALHINQEKKNPKQYLGVAALNQNRLYTIATQGILRTGENGFEQCDALKNIIGGKYLTIKQNQLFLVGYKTISRLPLNGEDPLRTYDIKRPDFIPGTVRAFTVDTSLRMWVAGDSGLWVVDADTEKRTHYAPGSVDAIRGRITDIYVVGEGPALPDATPVQSSPITGRFTDNGKPAAGIDIEVCPSANTFSKSDPCDGQPFIKTATTDAKGNFTVNQVPLVAVQFAFRKKEGKWVVPLSTCCEHRTADTPFSLGDIELSKGSAAFLFR